MYYDYKPEHADHKITVGHRSISDQSSYWHGQIELCAWSKMCPDILTTFIKYLFAFQLEHATRVG